MGKGGGRQSFGAGGERITVLGRGDVTVAGAVWRRVVERRGADGFALDAALTVEHFTFDVFVVSGHGRLGGFVYVGRGRRPEVCACAQDQSAQGKIVENFAAVPPDIGAAVFAYAFIVEPVHGRDLPRLVIATDKGDPVRIANLEAEEQEEGFERVETPVDEVAHEEVVRVRDVTADPEEFHKVVELAVDVATYRHGCVDRDHVAFFDE